MTSRYVLDAEALSVWRPESLGPAYSPKRAGRAACKKQNAGTHEAFRRLNYAFLTLVRKGDAKARHSEILMIAAVTGLELKRLIDVGGLADNN
ncbi:MAG: hypothetical protein QOE81_390 [Verrucomicrobiota bacterium]|jgi:hypothetical protein